MAVPLTLKVFPVPVALLPAVPPITSVVSVVILKVFELIVIPVTVPVPIAEPILIALEPQVLNVFPFAVTVFIFVYTPTFKSSLK